MSGVARIIPSTEVDLLSRFARSRRSPYTRAGAVGVRYVVLYASIVVKLTHGAILYYWVLFEVLTPEFMDTQAIMPILLPLQEEKTRA